MFDRFTDRARKVMALARKAALGMGHDFVGTRHLLLACLEEGTGVAANALKNLGATLPDLRKAVEARRGVGDPSSCRVSIPFSSRAKEALEGAGKEAMALGHNYIGTEHLLLGLLRDPESAAADCLRDLGIGADVLRNEVFILLGAHLPERPGSLDLTDGQGRVRVTILAQDQPAVILFDEQGRERIVLRLGPDGAPLFELKDAEGQVLFRAP